MNTGKAIQQVLNKVVTAETIIDISAAMSKLTGIYVTPQMIKKWQSRKSRMPLEMVPAFVDATNNYELLDVMAESCGFSVLRGKEIAFYKLAKLQQMQECIYPILPDKHNEKILATVGK